MCSCCTTAREASRQKNICPSLWSKKRKIQILEQELADAKKSVQELETLIAEVKAEK